MRALQGSGWLLVGLLLGLLVPVTGAHLRLVEWLGRRLPLPWGGLLVGTLLFAACAGLYFRSHWAASARSHRRLVERAADTGRRLASVGDEIERAAFLIGDNLAEVATAEDSRRQLFLEGVRAHAERLRVLAQRCRGLASRLDPRAAEPADGRGGGDE